MNHKELYDRLCDFSDRAAVLAEPLFARRATAEAADQLTRAASGAAANYRAAHYARSHAEFCSRLTVALEEIDEAGHWLARIRRRKLLSGVELESLAAESIELARILGASHRTARRNERQRETDLRARPRRRRQSSSPRSDASRRDARPDAGPMDATPDDETEDIWEGR